MFRDESWQRSSHSSDLPEDLQWLGEQLTQQAQTLAAHYPPPKANELLHAFAQGHPAESLSNPHAAPMAIAFAPAGGARFVLGPMQCVAAVASVLAVAGLVLVFMNGGTQSATQPNQAVSFSTAQLGQAPPDLTSAAGMPVGPLKHAASMPEIAEVHSDANTASGLQLWPAFFELSRPEQEAVLDLMESGEGEDLRASI